jgi:hypothetical protein
VSELYVPRLGIELPKRYRDRLVVPSAGVLGAGSRPAYADVVLADSPALYWPLDETAGAATAADLSGNGRTGAKSANAQGSRVGPVSGQTATDLDGAAGAVITSTYNPFVNGVARTFEAWVLRDGTTNDTIFGAAAQFMVRVTGASTVAFDVNTAVGFDSTWTVTLDAAWHHVVVVFNEPGNTVELFVDGVSIASRATTDQWDAPGNFQAGRRAGSDPLDGGLAHLAVYEGALSAARVLAHYEAA